jgi:DNA polymerase III subunit delta
MKFEQIIAELKNKVYRPVYVLMGEEPFFIDQISDYIEEHVLDESEKSFNLTISYGKDTDVQTLISYAKRFPMMANHQVIIIKEAQNLDKIDDFLSYVENPLKSTILVLCYKYKTLDKRKAFTKSVAKHGVLFESDKLYDNQLPEWITNLIKQKGYSISPKASVLLSEYLGSDLTRIVNELGKVMLNVPINTEITADHIEQNIGISKDFNIFELQKAIGVKNIFKANQIITYFAANPKDNPLIVTLANFYQFFSKILIYHSLSDKSRNAVASALSINPYFINDYQIAAKNYSQTKLITIIGYLHEYDLKSKGMDNISADDGELLKELLYKILH